MKRIGNLYEEIISKENLHYAFLKAKKGKKNKIPVERFEKNLNYNIDKLHAELSNFTYEPKPYFKFKVWEPKERIIYAPAFRDRVVQHAIYLKVRSIFDKRFIHTSFACRNGKGTHKAADYVQSCMSQVSDDSYVVQMDIEKYYYTLDRKILKSLLEDVIKDHRLIQLMMLFTKVGGKTGVPIGNLLSQLFGLIYLNVFDHFVKRELKVKFYVRYVDDFLMIGLSKEEAQVFSELAEEFINERLNLKLSKLDIFKVKRGINFVGFRTWNDFRLVRKHSLYTLRRNTKNNKKDSVIASLGHAKKTASHKHMLIFIKEHNDDLYYKLPEKVRRTHNLLAE